VEVDICDSPVFVIGSPRSGTTALAFALGQHPGLATSDESQILVDLFFKGALDRNYARGESTSSATRASAPRSSSPMWGWASTAGSPA
jgi:hypothetical protein